MSIVLVPLLGGGAMTSVVAGVGITPCMLTHRYTPLPDSYREGIAPPTLRIVLFLHLSLFFNH
jgi:hypothetical protein